MEGLFLGLAFLCGSRALVVVCGRVGKRGCIRKQEKEEGRKEIILRT